MKILSQCGALGLYLGIGVILGCTIMLAKDFDMGMVVGGIIAIISAGIYTFSMWKTGQLFKRDNEVEHDEQA